MTGVSAEWTVERLDALPEFSVITWTEGGEPYEAIQHESHWTDTFRNSYGSYYVIKDADPGSIRVVSAPIDALLADETAAVVAARIGEAISVPLVRAVGRFALRAAVAHVTGEATT